MRDEILKIKVVMSLPVMVDEGIHITFQPEERTTLSSVNNLIYQTKY